MGLIKTAIGAGTALTAVKMVTNHMERTGTSLPSALPSGLLGGGSKSNSSPALVDSSVVSVPQHPRCNCPHCPQNSNGGGYPNDGWQGNNNNNYGNGYNNNSNYPPRRVQSNNPFGNGTGYANGNGQGYDDYDSYEGGYENKHDPRERRYVDQQAYYQPPSYYSAPPPPRRAVGYGEDVKSKY